ncbi:hypothetical protein SASPL_152551 [Salvia splendens]|uniref:Transmembrane protein n=1 Tax=Salvia splendens TaxID=180675 RepID=A0A8X8W3U0_SALSN|nr:uncharacterized protein LOC121784545 [Salvia splendens]KAG6387364.1 hypothetical protein SASPL_152551 [Salvia splendens]
MDATRNRGRGRFLACFRPLTLDAADYDPVSAPPSVQSSPVRKKKLRRSLSAALKAVIFRTTLLKKSRSENSRDEYADRRISFWPFRGKGFIKSKKKKNASPLAPDGGIWPSANASPLFSSDASQTSSVSSLSGSARSSPARSEAESVQGCVSVDHFRQMNLNTKRRAVKKCSYNMEICVLLMCLAALIWGKVFAVVACTSAWLFIAPGGKVGRAESYELGDSEEYKKRVMMEGLLERDRCRVFQY